MPLYEYTCTGCQHDFEALVFSDKESVECPTCEGKKVSKKISRPGVAKVNAGGSLPMGCPTEGPPCNPHCCRLN